VNRTPTGLVAMLIAVAAIAACVAPTGGWDPAPILERHPRVAAIPDHRLGDLTPYPALVGERVVMVACRFDDGVTPIPVEVDRDVWPEAWGEIAVGALDRALPRVSLATRPLGAQGGGGPAIRVRSIEGMGEGGPQGLADTLSECRVSETGRADAPVAGRIQHAEIRIRRQVVDNAGRVRDALPEEWVGAMLHELAHALGFQGHAAAGRSLLQLEQSQLRRLGRRALAGEPVPAPNLSALFALPPGTWLGDLQLTERGERARTEARAAVDTESARRGPASGPLSTTGDREARLVWRWEDGTQIVLRFPDWSDALRWRRPPEASWFRVARATTR